MIKSHKDYESFKAIHGHAIATIMDLESEAITVREAQAVGQLLQVAVLALGAAAQANTFNKMFFPSTQDNQGPLQ